MAIRSTSKEVKNAIRAWILEHAADPDELGYDEDIFRPANPADFKQIARMILDVFRSEKGWRIRQIGEYHAITEWFEGLPSILNTIPLVEYYTARQTVKGWLQQTDAEAAKYGDDEVIHTALHLVARELFAAVR